MDEPTFASRLRAELERAGLSHREFAKRVGVNRSMPAQWLNGSEPKRPTLERIYALFPELQPARARKPRRPRQAATVPGGPQ